MNIAEVVYIYPGDVGAIERHDVRQGGSVIEHTPEEDWSVRIAEFKRFNGERPSLNAVVQPLHAGVLRLAAGVGTAGMTPLNWRG
ncbi:hypothetical protein [Microbacterium sp.]|uniref:hypothetical protein n=1 Tax=Microbacterium sp. TaxID=51671 RepID=UPI0025E1E000|nr:hypothetical protein [Microbacterium sp.]MBT9607747.1 hypothetical protein [Microbacterium sp.]